MSCSSACDLGKPRAPQSLEASQPLFHGAAPSVNTSEPERRCCYSALAFAVHQAPSPSLPSLFFPPLPPKPSTSGSCTLSPRASLGKLVRKDCPVLLV